MQVPTTWARPVVRTSQSSVQAERTARPAANEAPLAGDNNTGDPCTLRSIDTALEPQLAVNVTGVVAVTTLGASVNGAELLPEEPSPLRHRSSAWSP